jgi:hypothetical protein
MIASYQGLGGYAQAGYFMWPGSVINNFWEYNQNGGIYFRGFSGTVADGEEHRYWENYEPLCTCEQMIVDLTVMASTPWSPFTVWMTPFSPQWFGETKYCESDVPGAPGVDARYSELGVQNQSDDAFTGSLPGLGSLAYCAPRYGQNVPAPQPGLGTVFDIWTNP